MSPIMKGTFFLAVVLFKTILVFGQNNNDTYLLYQFDKLLNQPFPQLALEDEKGDSINTASLKGKTLYVDFWFTQCPPCLKQIPYSESLKRFFAADTNIVFVNICIENVERKEAWKQMVEDKGIGGVNLFYARNKPQKVNLLRQYKVEDFPTYMIVNSELKVIGHNGPAPSDKGLVQWCIYQATKNIKLSDSFLLWRRNSKEVQEFMKNVAGRLDQL